MVSFWLPRKDIYFLAYYFAVCTLSWHTSTKNGATVGKILLHTLVGLAEDEMEVHETVNGDDLLIGSGSVLFHARYQIDFLPRRIVIKLYLIVMQFFAFVFAPQLFHS